LRHEGLRLNADALEDRKMRPLARVFRCARNSGLPILLLAGTFMLETTSGFASEAKSESIQATYSQAGNAIAVTLIIYNYSTPLDLQLSAAFQQGQDRGLAAALFKTKAVGHCSITGTLSYDVAFIQMVPTPTGRKITFITSRPHPFNESDPTGLSPPFDLAVGQFDLNDADPSKSTGFLYPASKLVIDPQGEFHYDLAGNPWSLVNVLDSKPTPTEVLAQIPAK
jgi:hypothetical protein